MYVVYTRYTIIVIVEEWANKNYRQFAKNNLSTKRNRHSEYPSVISSKHEVAPTGVVSTFQLLNLVGSSGELPIDCSTWLGSKKKRRDAVVVF